MSKAARPARKGRIPTKKVRKLVLASGTYWYRVGKSSQTIVVWESDGTRHLTSNMEVTGRSPDTVERGLWKKTSDCSVTPQDIRLYIERGFTSAYGETP